MPASSLEGLGQAGPSRHRSRTLPSDSRGGVQSVPEESGLSTDQVNRIEAIFQAVLPELRKGRDDLERHEAELSRLIESSADEALVTRQIDKVEAIRSRLNKARQLLLLHHRQVLTPEQRVKLAQAERERAGRPPNAQKP